MSRRLTAVFAALAVLLAAAPAASGHATLEASTPERGAVVPAAPGEVTFRFSEPVEGAFGAIRVYDASGATVDDGRVSRPGGSSSAIGIGLRSGLADGTYTATYRVISADGHPVSGGLTFSIGAPGSGPAKTVDELLDTAQAGPVTRTAFDLVRGLFYLATALALGSLLFVRRVWRPVGAAADGALAERAHKVLVGAAVLGLLGSAGVVVLQGAVAGGTSGWAALDPQVIGDVVSTRLGRTFAIGFGLWVAVGALALVRAKAAVVPAAGLAFVPAFAGHAAAQSPQALLIPMDVLHVAAMALWLGGLVTLVLVVPAATRLLDPVARTGALAAVLPRFSLLALACVGALAVTGTVQAIVHLDAVADLCETTFGKLVLAKIVLLGVIAAVAAWNRQRLVPALARAAREGAPPARTGRLLRRSLLAEVALIVAVLGVTSVLVTEPPPSSAVSGPRSFDRTMGPLDLNLTIDPARPGANEMHVYLFAKRDGAPFTGTEELTVRASLPENDIAPLEVTMRKAGDGHYVGDAVVLQPAGEWRLDVVARVSDFDQYDTTVKVEIK